MTNPLTLPSPTTTTTDTLTMPRPPKAIADDTTSQFADQPLAQAGQAAQDLQALTTAFSDAERKTTLLVGQRLGRKSIFESISKLLTVTNYLDLKKIKESKEYKGLRVNVDGKLLTVHTWEDYCLHVEGRSRDSIDLDLKNLELLGPDLFNASRQLGIGPATMRSLRKLPDDQKDELLEIANTGDKDVFLQTIDDLSTKHAREKEAAAKAAATALAVAEEKLAAKDRALAASSATIAGLHEQLGGTFAPRPGSMARTQQEEDLLEDITSITLQTGELMRRLFLAADTAFEAPVGEGVKDVARQSVEFLCQELAGVAVEFGIKVDFENLINPPWMSEATQQAIQAKVAQAQAQDAAKAAARAAGKTKLSAVPPSPAQ